MDRLRKLPSPLPTTWFFLSKIRLKVRGSRRAGHTTTLEGCDCCPLFRSPWRTNVQEEDLGQRQSARRERAGLIWTLASLMICGRSLLRWHCQKKCQAHNNMISRRWSGSSQNTRRCRKCSFGQPFKFGPAGRKEQKIFPIMFCRSWPFTFGQSFSDDAQHLFSSKCRACFGAHCHALQLYQHGFRKW